MRGNLQWLSTGPDPGGWFLSLFVEEKRGRVGRWHEKRDDRRCVPMALDYVARSASNRVSRFVWNLIPLREGSWNQDIWRGRNHTGRQATPSARRTRRRRRRFSFAVAINRTYVTFSTFQLYWIDRAVNAIDSVTRAMRLSGRVLGRLQCLVF